MTDDAAGLAGLLQEYTGWQIEYQEDLSAWVAVRRPTPTGLHVLVAHDLPGLRSKLANAEAGAPRQSTASP